MSQTGGSHSDRPVEASIIRIPPHHYIHVLDQNTNIARVEIGPLTYIRQDNERSETKSLSVEPPSDRTPRGCWEQLFKEGLQLLLILFSASWFSPRDRFNWLTGWWSEIFVVFLISWSTESMLNNSCRNIRMLCFVSFCHLEVVEIKPTPGSKRTQARLWLIKW